MRIYDCVVNIVDTNGIVLTQVVKQGVTSAEIVLLRHIHGQDKVVKIVPRTQDKRPHALERQRLAAKYNSEARGDIVQAVFGLSHLRLPVDLADFEEPADEPSKEGEAKTAAA